MNWRNSQWCNTGILISKWSNRASFTANQNIQIKSCEFLSVMTTEKCSYESPLISTPRSVSLGSDVGYSLMYVAAWGRTHIYGSRSVAISHTISHVIPFETVLSMWCKLSRCFDPPSPPRATHNMCHHSCKMTRERFKSMLCFYSCYNAIIAPGGKCCFI